MIPEPDTARLNAVAAALRARDAKTAALLAEIDLAKGAEHPLLFTARAIWLTENGRHGDALGDFLRATRLSPSNAAAWSAEGLCLIALHRFGEAAEAFDKAIALQPNAPILHARKGWALEQVPDPAASKAAYLRALELDPNNAEALGRVAFLAVQQGAWAEARSYAERAVRVQPAHQTARFVLATADIGEGRFEEADRQLLALLGDKALSAANRAPALAALGDLRDRQGRVDEAFQAYTEANRVSLGLPGKSTGPGGMSMADVVDALSTYFVGKDRLPRPAAAGEAPCATHVFLLGFLRSGTTLLEQVLAAHPQVVTLEEKGPIAGAVDDYMPRNLDALYAASEATLDTHRARYWQRVRGHGIDPTDKVFVDKGPIYTVDLPVIARLFPDAKILFSVRDPRDVVLSCFRTHFDLNATTVEFLTLDGTAKFYAAVMTLAEIYREVLPIAFHDVRHEAFVEDPEAEARKLCAVLGVTFDAAMLAFARRDGAIATASAAQIRCGLNREGIGRWRAYATQLALVLPLLQPWVEKFGYPAR